MPDVKVRILFSVDGLAGVKTATQSTAEAKREIQEVGQASESTATHIQNVGKRSGMARMAVISFSQGLQDSAMFQQSFRMGMMSITNNIDMVVQSLTMLKEESASTGVSMKSALLNVLKGPSGILIALSVFITLVQILPGLLEKTGSQAKKTADDLDQFKSAIGKISRENILSYTTDIDRRIAVLTEQRRKISDELAGAGGLLARGTPTGGWLAAQGSVIDRKIEEAKKEREALEKEFNSRLEGNYGIIEKTRAEIENTNKKLNDANLTEAQRRKILDERVRLENNLKELQLTTIDRLKQSEDYHRAIMENETELLSVRRKSRDDLVNVLSAELAWTTTMKERYSIEQEIGKLRHEQAREAGLPLGPSRIKGAGFITPGTKGMPGALTPFGPLPGSIAYQQAAIARLEEKYGLANTDAERERIKVLIGEQQSLLNKMLNSTESQMQAIVVDAEQIGNIMADAFSGGNSQAQKLIGALRIMLTIATNIAQLQRVQQTAVGIGTLGPIGGIVGGILSLAALFAPRHGMGGITTGPHVAMVGEVPEAIIPLERLANNSSISMVQAMKAALNDIRWSARIDKIGNDISIVIDKVASDKKRYGI